MRRFGFEMNILRFRRPKASENELPLKKMEQIHLDSQTANAHETAICRTAHSEPRNRYWRSARCVLYFTLIRQRQ